MDGKIHWKLEGILKELGITPNKLAVEAKIRPTTIYKIHYNEASRIHIPNIEVILNTINSISACQGKNKIYDVSDLLEYRILK